MKLWDIVLIVLIAAAAGLAVRRLVANRKAGKTACGCDCARCARGGACGKPTSGRDGGAGR